MAYFPFYMDISNKVGLVVGGGKIALRKIEVLSQFDAKIIVIAADICEEIYNLVKTKEKKSDKELAEKSDEESGETREKIVIVKRRFRDEDIAEAEFVIAATNDELLNSHISDLCRQHNILVNVVDVKEECSFIFPAIVKKNELVISISTGGNCPAMAAKIKENIEGIIPYYYGELMELLGENREYIKKNVNILENRKKVYSELMQIAETNQENIAEELIHEVVEKYR